MKQNVLFIMTALNGGGAENVLTTLLNNIDYNKYDVELLLTFTDEIYIDKIPKKIKISSIYGKRHFFRRILIYLYRHFGWSRLLKILVRKQCTRKYDTIVSFMEAEPLLYHSMIIDYAHRNITWVHCDFSMNHWSKNYFYANAENDAYNKMDTIIYVSYRVKDRFNDILQINNNVVQKVIYNILDPNSIRKRSLQNSVICKSKFTICASGRLEKPKAFHRLINIAKILVNKGFDFEVWILGEGTLHHSLLTMVKEKKLENIVHLLGFYENPYPIMRQADIFVSTSITEGFPIVICEALILGLPIIATKITGSIELLQNEYGVLVEEDEGKIAEKISDLIIDVNKCMLYRDKSLERAKMFDINRSMKVIYDCLGK